MPYNDAPDAADSHAATIGGTWQRYYDGWTAWYHVRTATFTASTTCLALAAIRG